MPSSPGYKRNYKQENKTAKKRGEHIDKRQRMKDRRKAVKKHGAAALKGKDVDHAKKGAKGSTTIKSVKANRSHGGRIGNRAGKAAGGRKGGKK